MFIHETGATDGGALKNMFHGEGSEDFWGKMGARIEAAGCLGITGPDLWTCLQDSELADSTAGDDVYQAEMLSACRAGGWVSCGVFFRALLDTGEKCGDAQDAITKLHPNIKCDCQKRQCTEINELTPQQRRDQQIANLAGAAQDAPPGDPAIGEAMAVPGDATGLTWLEHKWMGVPYWALGAGALALGVWWWRSSRKAGA